MKERIKSILQGMMGLDNYLFVFSLFKIYTLKFDKKENDFFHFQKMISHPGDILDIGANIGIMTAHLARTYPLRNIVSFEPVPENLNALRKIIRFFRLNNVEIRSIAVGESDKQISILVPVKNKVFLQGLSHVKTDNNEEGISVSCLMRSLDSLRKEGRLNKVAAIKIDVENYEFEVFKGAMKLLETDRPVIYCELWDNENRQQTFRLIKESGYSIKILKDNYLQDYNGEACQNFFFIPQDATFIKN